MNDRGPLDPTRNKVIALCAHLENLCASAVCAVRSGNLETLDKLEARKTIVLQEIIRMLKLPEISKSSDLVPSIVDRARSALRAELETVTATAGRIRIKRSLLRAQAQDLSKLRASYGSADFSGRSRSRVTPSTIIARG